MVREGRGAQNQYHVERKLSGLVFQTSEEASHSAEGLTVCCAIFSPWGFSSLIACTGRSPGCGKGPEQGHIPGGLAALGSGLRPLADQAVLDFGKLIYTVL